MLLLTLQFEQCQDLEILIIPTLPHVSPKYFTPFKYYEAKNIMYGGGLDTGFVVLSVVLIAGLSFITFSFYKKRDLHV